ncbi:MAG: hypothetical protein ACLTHL_03040 [Collinsella sp.]
MNIACVASITGAQIMLATRGANAVMIGLLGTAMGVSTLVGSLLANKLVDMVPTGKLIAGALALFVVSQMPLLFLHSYAAILICQILAGLPFPALNAGLLGFLYGKTPDNMQGRASAVFETTVGILGAACGRGLRTFSWRPNGKIFVCPVLRNESVRWSCISPRR